MRVYAVLDGPVVREIFAREQDAKRYVANSAGFKLVIIPRELRTGWSSK